RWPSFSLVVIEMLVGILRSAAAVQARSGLLAKRFPPRSTQAWMRPSAAATIEEYVSWPTPGTTRMPYSSSSRAANACFRLGVMPHDPTPCTFECPRMGSSPHPGRPSQPRASARLASARTLSTPCAWCVSPIRSEEHTSELQSPDHLVCRLLLEKKKK